MPTLEPLLGRVPLFSALTDAQRRRALEGSSILQLEEGRVLFQCGDPAEHFFLVLEGQVKLYRLSLKGVEKVLGLVHPGQTFAEAIMFMEAKAYPVSAAAIMPSRLLRVRNNAFIELLRGSTDTCFRVMAALSQRLRVLVDDIDRLTMESANYRVASYLVEVLDRGPVPVREIHLDTSKTVLASHLSIAPETLSRTLRRLSEEGTIQVHGRAVEILDLVRLKRLAQGA